jgi:endonuclease/exonuclease/phosphatase family metal-dependent hydrolase
MIMSNPPKATFEDRLDPLCVSEAIGLAPHEAPHHRFPAMRIRSFAAAALTLAGVSYGVHAYTNDPGQVDSYAPRHPIAPAIDDTLRIGSWNMHNEAAARANQISKFIRTDRLDALLLQEVNRQDAVRLSTLLPQYNQKFVLADVNQHPLEGGYGNMIISRQPLRDVHTQSFQGTGPVRTLTETSTIASNDAWGDQSFTNVFDGRQESRAAISGTIKMRSQGRLRDVRIATAHIAGGLYPDIHRSQFKSLFKFIADETTSDRPTIFCGDLNAGDNEVMPASAQIKFIPDINPGRTSTSSPKKIDHCIYSDAGMLQIPRIMVTKFRTDHYAKMFTVQSIP